MNHHDPNDALERSLADWLQDRREQDSPGTDFTQAVMERVHSCSTAPPAPVRVDSTIRPPRALLASLCLCAGLGKLALILHLAF